MFLQKLMQGMKLREIEMCCWGPMQVERYVFFPACARRFELETTSLLEQGKDEDEQEGMLASALRVLQQARHSVPPCLPLSQKLLHMLQSRTPLRQNCRRECNELHSYCRGHIIIINQTVLHVIDIYSIDIYSFGCAKALHKS